MRIVVFVGGRVGCDTTRGAVPGHLADEGNAGDPAVPHVSHGCRYSTKMLFPSMNASSKMSSVMIWEQVPILYKQNLLCLRLRNNIVQNIHES